MWNQVSLWFVTYKYRSGILNIIDKSSKHLDSVEALFNLAENASKPDTSTFSKPDKLL